MAYVSILFVYGDTYNMYYSYVFIHLLSGGREVGNKLQLSCGSTVHM